MNVREMPGGFAGLYERAMLDRLNRRTVKLVDDLLKRRFFLGRRREAHRSSNAMLTAITACESAA
jgi:hypothetical protein